jgi:hypothetical protein
MRNGLVPVNSYFLFTQLVENNSWITLKNNIREFFFIKGNFIYCFDTYDSNELSNSEVSCLFETIRDYKKSGKEGFVNMFIDSINERLSLFNEVSVIELAKAMQVNDSMYRYIGYSVKNELLNSRSGNHKMSIDGAKLSLLSRIKIGSVIQDVQGYATCVVVSVSFKQYMVVKVIQDKKILLNDLFDDLKRSFIVLNSKYDFMITEAIIDCVQMFTINYDSAYHWIRNESRTIVGEIDKGDIDAILTAIQASSTITAYMKDEFSFS